MKASPPQLQGLERVRARFLSLLAERQTHISHHALAAWDTDSIDEQHFHLQEAGSVLHMIAGSAGSLGFNALGAAAQSCEAAILNLCDESTAPQEAMLHATIAEIDGFVSISQSLLDEFG